MVRVKDTIRLRLEKMVDRYEEIGRSLADPAVIGRQREFRELSQEYARLTPVAEKFASFQSLERELASAREMQSDNDPGMREMGQEEMTRLAPEIERTEDALKMLLIPARPRAMTRTSISKCAPAPAATRPRSSRATCIACTHASPKTHGFSVEILSESAGEHGGFREVISRIAGPGRVRALQVRVRCAPRAARARHRSAGAHPHVGLHGGHPARARRSGSRGSEPR
jgi:peptide chain release factor 1